MESRLDDWKMIRPESEMARNGDCDELDLSFSFSSFFSFFLSFLSFFFLSSRSRLFSSFHSNPIHINIEINFSF